MKVRTPGPEYVFDLGEGGTLRVTFIPPTLAPFLDRAVEDWKASARSTAIPPSVKAASVEWTHCGDHMPDADERVLVAIDGDVWCATWSDEANAFPRAVWITDDGTPIEARRVSYWARMPDAPE